MTVDKARELLTNQAQVASMYTRNGARLILAEVQREHGQQTVDALIRELDLENIFGFAPGTKFKGA
ncbi:MAG: hypothetical protein ABFS45_00115 [Pseudomonadota bacterium]